MTTPKLPPDESNPWRSGAPDTDRMREGRMLEIRSTDPVSALHPRWSPRRRTQNAGSVPHLPGGWPECWEWRFADTPDPPPVRPKRPSYTGDRTPINSARHLDALQWWRDAVEEWDEAEEARALTAGQAVFDRMVAAEMAYERAAEAWEEGLEADVLSHDRPSVPRAATVAITPSDFRDWQTWCRTYGGPTFDLPLSYEFEMFSGSVLVVVR